MLIRYRTNSSLTAANLISDFNKIIAGEIATVNDFSSGCDKGNTSITGTYPANVYSTVHANVQSGLYTFSKVHNDYVNTTHYFRLQFDTISPSLTTIALAKDWDSGSNSLVNSQAMTQENVVHGVVVGIINEYVMTINNFNNPDATHFGINNGRSANLAIGDRIEPTYGYDSFVLPKRQTRLVSQLTGTVGQTGNYYVNIFHRTSTINYPCTVFRETSNLTTTSYAFDAYNQKTGIDFVITDKCFFISWPTNGLSHGIFDIGKNGISNQYNSSMLMGMVDLRAEFLKIPYSYKVNTQSYGTLSDVHLTYSTPSRMRSSNQSITVIENPVTGKVAETGNPELSIYGLFRIPNTLVPGTTYVGPSSVTRLVPIQNFSIITE